MIVCLGFSEIRLESDKFKISKKITNLEKEISRLNSEGDWEGEIKLSNEVQSLNILFLDYDRKIKEINSILNLLANDLKFVEDNNKTGSNVFKENHHDEEKK